MEWLGVDRRRLGTGLLALGIVGMVLAGLIAAGLVGGAVAVRNLGDRVETDQRQLVGVLDRLAGAADRLAMGTEHASDTLRATRDIVVEAGPILGDIATASDQLASSLDVSILGSRPFAGASGTLRTLSGRVTLFAGRTTSLAADLEVNASDMTDVAAQVQGIGADAAAGSARISSFDRTGAIINLVIGGILVGGLVAAWLALAATLCVWAGWRLRRPTANRTDSPPSPRAPTPPA